MKSRSALLLGVAVLLGSIVAFWSSRTRGEAAPTSSKRRALEEQETTGPIELEGLSAAEVGAPAREPQGDRDASSSQRTAEHGDVLNAALTGRVVADDLPVRDAEVSWTPLNETTIQKGTPWTDKDWTAVERETRRTRTRADGSFSLAELPAEGGELPTAAVWVTHPAFEAAYSVLDAGRAGGSVDFELVPSKGLRGRVVDGNSGTVAGAFVRQMGLPGPWADEAGGAIAVLARTFEADADGRAELHPLPPSSVVVASDGHRRSAPHGGGVRGETTLVLQDTFDAAGVVRGEGFSTGNPAIVECFAERGALSRSLARLAVAPDGAWGPASLPCLDVDRYRFRLEGGNATPAERFVEPPDAGESIGVDFDVEIGEALWALPTDAEDQPLLDAEVWASWTDEAGSVTGMSAKPFQKGHQYEGYVLFLGVPHGEVVLRASCHGYEPLTTGPIRIPDETDLVLQLPLRAGATLHGRCVHGGEPVTDFDILHWDGRGSSPVRDSFRDREDGSFEIPALVGEVRILAVSERYPRSRAIGIDLEAGDVEGIVLELLDPVRCSGRIVNQATGQPLAGASVQLWASHLGTNVAPWGAPTQSDDGGRFALRGLIAGRNTLQFDADGYSRLLLDATSAGGDVALGDVSLVATLRLEIALVAEHDLDPAGYVLGLTGQRDVDGARFDERGVARIDDMASGRVWFTLDQPDGSYLRGQTYLPPGASSVRWELDVGASGNDVVLQVRHDGDGQPPAKLQARIAWFDERGEARALTRRLDDDLRAVFSGIPPGDVHLTAYGHDGLAGVGRATVTGAEREELLLVVGSDDVVIRALDRGEPVAGADVMLDPEGSGGFWHRNTSDAGGIARFPGTAAGRYAVHLSHPDLGQRTDLPIVVEPDAPGPIDVSFGDPISVSVRVEAEGVPVAGANCELHSAAGTYYVGKELTSSSGIATWDSLGAGTYRVTVRHSRFSAGSGVVEARTGTEAPALIPLRPLGALAVMVSRDGTPVGGALVDLTDLASGDRVDAWLRDGRADSSTGAAVTGEDGRLELRRLPAGAYSWRVGETSGQVEVSAGGTAELPIRL